MSEPAASIPAAWVPAIVLAGGKAKPELAARIGQTNRALAVVNGKTLLAHVTDALTGVSAGITVVGDVPPSEAYGVIADTGSLVENVCAGLDPLADAPYALLATSDLPFLTQDAVSEFLDGAVALCQSSGAALIYPIVSVDTCYATFPGIRRTAVRLREGQFTGGNLMLVRPGFLLGQRRRISEAYSARKSVVRLGRMLGGGAIVRLLLSQLISPQLLTIPYLEQRASRLLGGPARALISTRPEIATDLDKPADFDAIEDHEPDRAITANP